VKATTAILPAFEIPPTRERVRRERSPPALLALPCLVIQDVIVRFATLIASYSPPIVLDINFNHSACNAYVPL